MPTSIPFSCCTWSLVISCTFLNHGICSWYGSAALTLPYMVHKNQICGTYVLYIQDLLCNLRPVNWSVDLLLEAICVIWLLTYYLLLLVRCSILVSFCLIDIWSDLLVNIWYDLFVVHTWLGDMDVCRNIMSVMMSYYFIFYMLMFCSLLNY